LLLLFVIWHFAIFFDNALLVVKVLVTQVS